MSSSGRFFHVLLNTQGAIKFRALREVVWVILDLFRMAVFCCCPSCGHVGSALALSIMSTAMLDVRVVGL